MGYQLRREEVLDVAGLRAMLEQSPGKAAQAILAAAGQGVVEAQCCWGRSCSMGAG